jgi:hypothetical protein
MKQNEINRCRHEALVDNTGELKGKAGIRIPFKTLWYKDRADKAPC